jgi:hypothetical protein
MIRSPSAVSVAAFAVAACVLATGCPQAQQEGPKTVSPGSNTGMRLEKGFRKKANAPATPEQDAVFTFLDDDKQRFQTATASLTPDSQPSGFTKSLNQYVEQLEKVDRSGLPKAFKGSTDRYVTAMKELPKALAPMPDSYEGTTFYTEMRGLLLGDKSKGKKLGGNVNEAVKSMWDAIQNMHETAEAYGIDTDK